MQPKPGRTTRFTFFFIYLAAISYTGNLVARTEGLLLFLGFFIAFFIYVWLCRLDVMEEKFLLATGLIARLSLFLTLPALSDDFYRFIWDGKLLDHGLSPYAFVPTAIVEELGWNSLYDQLNSPGFYSVYPPINQLVFWLSVKLADQPLGSVNVIRTLILLADIGAYFLLKRLLPAEKSKLAFYYFLNPLVVLELTGNIHFEGFVVLFLLLGLYALRRKKWLISGSFFGISIAVKLIPLIFLPFLTWSNRWKGGVLLGFSAILVAGVSFLPLISGAMRDGMGASLSLYFRSFEFNASLYYLFRQIGYWDVGYNIIQTLGPRLAWLTLLLITWMALWGSYRKVQTSEVLLFSLMIYLGLATTVHPWYILTLVPLGVLAGYHFPVVWTFMSFVSYFGYQDSGYELSMGWIVLEYTIVYGYMLWEIAKQNEKVRVLD